MERAGYSRTATSGTTSALPELCELAMGMTSPFAGAGQRVKKERTHGSGKLGLCSNFRLLHILYRQGGGSIILHRTGHLNEGEVLSAFADCCSLTQSVFVCSVNGKVGDSLRNLKQCAEVYPRRRHFISRVDEGPTFEKQKTAQHHARSRQAAVFGRRFL